jgi:UDP-glucose 4-epimerase
MTQQRVLVTGGAGFIGSELVRQLAGDGANVTVIDNLVNGKPGNLSDVDCRLVTGDIRDQALIKELMGQNDQVFHLACLGVRHSIHSPLENHQVNAEASLRLLMAARDAQVKKFIYVSSSEVYGTARHVPMDEDHPTFPMTVYGASKLAGECYTRAFGETYKLPSVVVRPFNSFGPRCHHEGDSGEVIPKFLLRLLAGRELFIFGDGEQTRDFTYVADTARGIIAAGKSADAVGQTINLGSGKEISMNRLAEIAKDVVGKPDAKITYLDPRPGDVLRLYANSNKARELANFAPTTTLKAGLKNLLRWYQSLDSSPEDLLADEIPKNWEVVTA